METIKDLIGLLMYQVDNLHSAEDQQIEFIPLIIEKAHHKSLKNALNHHLLLTKEQKARLEKIPGLISEKLNAVKHTVKSESLELVPTELNAGHVCKGMKGIVDEAKELFERELSADVTDAAIIAAIQKMEHYEICTYGTALAYASQLHIRSVESLLNETLDEEYDVNDLLTALAKASLNKEAEPEGMEALNQATDLLVDEEHGQTDTSNQDDDNSGKVIISERTVNSPGGRAGTSHRRYPSGESRGH